MINLIKTPDMLFSKSLTHTKYILQIQEDLIKHDASKLEEKKNYLNYSYIVLLYSEWQVFIQAVVEYGVKLKIERMNLTEAEVALLNNRCEKKTSAFGNPNTENINKLVENVLAIKKISDYWIYNECTLDEAKKKLSDISKIRNEIVHTATCHFDLNPEICFAYMEHLYKLSKITQKTIDDLIK